MCLFMGAFHLAAECQELPETVVESPRFNPKERVRRTETVGKPALCCYMESNLEYPLEEQQCGNEGVVVAIFVVDPDGKVADVVIENSVSRELDRCVKRCITSTSGQWLPGRVNGVAVPMESRVKVNFDIRGNGTHQEMANKYLLVAIRKCNRGDWLSLNPDINRHRVTRKYRQAHENLVLADRYAPNHPAIKHWHVVVYERQEDLTRMKTAMFELDDILLHALNE